MGYVLFSADSIMYIFTQHPKWNGIIEYSYDNKKWKEWHGEKIINNTIYMRGINNTIISNGYKWNVIGTNVKCQGNIENLLDYKSVINNVHPKISSRCFQRLFSDCTSLIEAPQLLTTELSKDCYARMFMGCVKLRHIPFMPCATTIKGCYQYMFCGCVSLRNSPLVTISDYQHDSHWRMFSQNISLTYLPIFDNYIIAKELIINQQMFKDCSLQQININNKLYDINVLKLL